MCNAFHRGFHRRTPDTWLNTRGTCSFTTLADESTGRGSHEPVSVTTSTKGDATVCRLGLRVHPTRDRPNRILDWSGARFHRNSGRTLLPSNTRRYCAVGGTCCEHAPVRNDLAPVFKALCGGLDVMWENRLLVAGSIGHYFEKIFEKRLFNYC